MLEHWPLSETKIQVAPNCGRAWAEWISHGLEIPARGYGEVRGIVVAYHPQEAVPELLMSVLKPKKSVPQAGSTDGQESLASVKRSRGRLRSTKQE